MDTGGQEFQGNNADGEPIAGAPDATVDGRVSFGATPISTPAGGSADPSADVAAPQPEKHGRSRWVAVGIVGVVVGGAVVGFLLSLGGTDPFSSGAGTATISWTSTNRNLGSSTYPSTPKDFTQQFSGDIDGVPVSGDATWNYSALIGAAQSEVLNPSSSTPHRLRMLGVKGRFDGKAFNFGLYIQYPVSTAAPGSGGFPDLQAIGTYGNEKMQAKLAPSASALKPNGPIPSSTPILLSGTIGNLKVTARIPQTATTHGKLNAVRVTIAIAR